MRKNSLKPILIMIILIVTFSSCTTLSKSMKEPNNRIEFNKSDFDFSDQVSAEASSTTIVGIDMTRLFKQETGVIESAAAAISMSSIPVIGNVLSDKTANYALYNLMDKYPGYDIILYPQYEKKIVKPIIGIGILTKISTVKVTARLGKLKK